MLPPQLRVQERVAPCTQANVSSAMTSPSSSQPLQISAAVHAWPANEHDVLHERVPALPQLVVHGWPVLLRTHAKASSGEPSQSSSAPLHVSAGGVGVNVSAVHVALHVNVPATLAQNAFEPVPLRVVPAMQIMPAPSSALPLQSSSRPLHASVAIGRTALELSLQSPPRFV
jgi:hypothetical protein